MCSAHENQSNGSEEKRIPTNVYRQEEQRLSLEFSAIDADGRKPNADHISFHGSDDEKILRGSNFFSELLLS